MRHIQLGNDVEVVWRIVQREEDGSVSPYDLEGRDLRVSLIIMNWAVAIENFSVEGNEIRFIYYGKDQFEAGTVRAVLVENAGKAGMRTMDKADIFRLVQWHRQEGGNDVEYVTTEKVELSSEVVVLSEAALPETVARKAWVTGLLAAYYSKTEVERLILQATEEGVKVSVDSVAGWDARKGYVPAKGEIVIYSDYRLAPDGDEFVAVPGIKIGSGNGYVQDLAFTDAAVAADLIAHIRDTSVHTTPEEKAFWNNKLNVEPTITEETIVFNRK